MSHPDQRSIVDPERTPLFVGTGVKFTGTISYDGPHEDRAVILGEFEGDLNWNGILQVPRGGKVVVHQTMRCREMMVGGEIVGANEEVVIETGLLRLGETGSIDVATVSLPPGGLEQSRGSVINARLRMSKQSAFAAHQPAAGVPQSAPSLALVASNERPASDQGDGHLVQIETRSGAVAGA